MKANRASVLALLGLVLAGLLPLHATAAGADKVEWIHPVIAGYGAVHPRPDVALQPDPTADYRVFVHLTGADKSQDKPMQSLDRLARLVNLMGFAKVPPRHVHIVALLDGPAALAGLTDAAYRKQFHHDNPDLKLIHALKQAGVKLLVCSQALAGHGLADSAVDPDVTITLSALTDQVIYGQRHYSYMQL